MCEQWFETLLSRVWCSLSFSVSWRFLGRKSDKFQFSIFRFFQQRMFLSRKGFSIFPGNEISLRFIVFRVLSDIIHIYCCSQAWTQVAFNSELLQHETRRDEISCSEIIPQLFFSPSCQFLKQKKKEFQQKCFLEVFIKFFLRREVSWQKAFENRNP